MKVCLHSKKVKLGSGWTQTYATEGPGALNQRLRPLGQATWYARIVIFAFHEKNFLVEVYFNLRNKKLSKIFKEKHPKIKKVAIISI